ncbi:unnamed protein product [Mycena citricolor]|uniref:RING-type E3 ubiquitin transferase n=1 Tax=Mycena citricolor TaxID=2018698 RepID=A0AAD2K6C8_9AGAR|nr:unnamed protein product [Mycena citricolor]
MPPIAQVLRERTQALTGSISTHRLLLYAVFSFFAVSAAIANALRNYSNFYSVAIYLSKSSRSVLVLANFGFIAALLTAHVVQKIFFGALRPSEVERLYDRLWFFVTESLLAFTIFRDEFDATFIMMFGFLLFVKAFHWIAADRIEWMDQRPYPGPPLLFHVRMSALFFLLWSIDFLVFMFAVDSTIVNGIGGMVLFASEYGILMATVSNTVCKYLLSTYEFRRASQRGGENAPQWESKSMWIFYVELATGASILLIQGVIDSEADFLKLTTYLVFFLVIMTFYGLPLNILRDVYVTTRSLITRLSSLHRYQTATRNMDQRYPNASEAEMAAMSDHTCIICREEMVLPAPPAEAAAAPGAAPAPAQDGPNTTPKKLPCGHIFHFNCLRSWLERQQSCPTCRRNVLEQPPRPANNAAAQAAAAGPGVNPAAPAPAVGQNNAFGLVNRWFPQPQQPNHGQAARPFPNLNAQNPNPPGQPILIEYHVQQQNPRQPDQPAVQPPPQFQGFPGPDGAWQPWPPIDDGAQQPHDPGEVLPAASSDATSVTPASDTPPEPSAASPAVASSATPSTPREAAALAALRRFNSGGTSAATRGDSAPQTAGPSQTTGQEVPKLKDPEVLTTDAPSASTEKRAQLPALIPLYDYSNAGVTSSAPRPSRTTRTGLRSESRYNPRPPISQLPPNLTDAQLAIMDQVTREAIDERLRVLEGVSSAVYRCIDDLMRMRSALPISTPTATATPAAASGTASSSTVLEPGPHTNVPTATTSLEQTNVAAVVPPSDEGGPSQPEPPTGPVENLDETVENLIPTENGELRVE